ncbi:Putative Zinc finger, UBP-type, Zinc finger, RING-type, BRCA1-associated 2 [Septoria linicola]|uniref:Zinc finger, UBP-type, Zinc finger, RING-type, BRCA1-associated 2 n=1 Tax=Septoria linicola TaxID=215465 RepID=A0A9Q9EK93_9PEZI|nr:putative Zinc finger, UBP-type, Zinc finger, RING-type, BRCA1-associated 2 [Septoria linicola]USW52158.1 Putative Zinc finger, UBP-type, Zinc finger, RING-type, BRCA1-associated 2 [Septoria linicola]
MSHFFFHLKLELYPTAAAHHSTYSFAGWSSTKINHDHNVSHFTPRPGTDIFSKTALPAHRTSKWPSQTFSKRAHSPTTAGSTTPTRSSSDSPAKHISPETERSSSHGNALLLPERSNNLRKEAPPSPRIPATTKHSNEAAATDWRYDRVEIESIDMERSKTGATGGLHTKAVYVPSDSKTTEAGWGVVHLYRDLEESKALDVDGLPQKSLDRSATDGTFDPGDCSTLCILAVPSWMMPSDLLSFLGEQAREEVSHFRLIRTARANKYMVLLKFRSAKKARDWQRANNGRLFSDLEPENCHVVFIKSVEFISPDEDVTSTSFPHNNHDPFTASSGASSILLSKPMPPPPPNLLELPTCPVCLERMDETTGLLTILCQHVFHCACLEKWKGSGCPVCRYTHAPSYTFPYPRPGGADEETETMCSVCAGTSNLWVCLICGNIGCGRYDSAHAFAHYEETSHCYAMDINTQHVWDYAGDGYVHRLIQSKPPTTPAATHDRHSSGYVDMPARRRHENEAFRAEGGDSVPREKMESMATEYTYLLTSQLEGQRRYFEEQVARAVDKAAQAGHRAEEAATSASKLEAQVASITSAFEQMKAQLQNAESKLEKAEKTRAKFEQMARDMGSRWREEKTMNEGLSQRITKAEQQVAEAKAEKEKAIAEKKDLEDMNHDLTMFISSQEKVKELEAAGEEVIDGHAYAPEQTAGKAKKGKGRKK